MQDAYRAAAEEWIAAIRREEVLVSANHSLAQVDCWTRRTRLRKRHETW
jgi:hypothetical protein